MHTLADFSAFLGSIWFAAAACLCGYIVGNLFPINKILKK
jgi:hypothetical protein